MSPLKSVCRETNLAPKWEFSNIVGKNMFITILVIQPIALKLGGVGNETVSEPLKPSSIIHSHWSFRSSHPGVSAIEPVFPTQSSENITARFSRWAPDAVRTSFLAQFNLSMTVQLTKNVTRKRCKSYSIRIPLIIFCWRAELLLCSCEHTPLGC